MSKHAVSTTPKTINLALQGGGAHGAFTWGVLDRLLDEKQLHIAGISGTSAGAMNAAMVASGYSSGGATGAQAKLAEFWQEISALGTIFSPFQQSPAESMGGFNLDWSFSYNWFDLMSRMVSPYQANPLNLNPLRWVLEKTLDVEATRACSAIRLFIAATNVRSGQAKVFECGDITVDVLLASACIPLLFQAVEIDGEPYWDGGYMGNPVLWPLIYQTPCEDILLVQINPLIREGTPDTAPEIINRLNEITFNSSLVAEMRAIRFVSRLRQQGKLDDGDYKDLNMHVIAAHPELEGLNASSKLNTRWDFFCLLRDHGRNAADAWLKAHWADIGTRSSVDIGDMFLGMRA